MRIIGVMLLLVLVWGCTTSIDKLGDRTFYKDDEIELRVVLFDENLPFHYVGETWFVECRSPNTASYPGNDRSRAAASWMGLLQADLSDENGVTFYVNQTRDEMLDTLATRAKEHYFVTDRMTVVVLGWQKTLDVSFDGCRSFSNFNPLESLPNKSMLINKTRFDSCMELYVRLNNTGSGSVICNRTELINAKPVYSNIDCAMNGSCTFDVLFTDLNHSFSVRTSDHGRTWQVS